jgi:hypothetical protein
MTKYKGNFRGKLTKDGQKQKNTESQKAYLDLPKGVKLYNAEEDIKEVYLDFLPYIVSDAKHPCKDSKENIAMVGDLWWRRPFKVHRNVGAENETVICPKSVGKTCPICVYQKELFERDKDNDREDAIALYPKDRNLYVVIPLDQKGYDEVPYIWDMSHYNFQKTLIEELEINPVNEVFPDLEEGKTLKVTFVWEDLGKNHFPKARKIDFYKREPYEESILKEVPDLDKVLKVLSYDELHAKFFQLEEVEQGGELHEKKEEEPRERKSRRTPVEEDAPPKRERPSRRDVEEAESHVPTRGSTTGRAKTEVESDAPPRRSRRTPVEEKEETPPRRSAGRERPSREVDKDNPCPHGHKFGVDIDNTDDCPDCNKYDDCLDESEKIKANRK